MKYAAHASICVAIAAATVAGPAIAAGPPDVIAEQARSVAGDRVVQVLVAQAEIKSDINPSNIAVATGGGLIGGLLAASQNASRTKKAEAAIEPIRASLADFDADGLALQTTKAGLAQAAWLKPTAISLGKDSSPSGKSALLDSSGASQVAFVEYSYDMSPDFSSVRVVAKLELANRQGPATAQGKPEARVSRKNLAYAQQITSIVSLPKPGGDKEANAALWNAEGGKAARQALTLAFGEIEKLLPRTLALTAAEVKLMAAKDKPKGNAGGFTGRIQETTPSSSLLWSGGFIKAQTLQ